MKQQQLQQKNKNYISLTPPRSKYRINNPADLHQHFMTWDTWCRLNIYYTKGKLVRMVPVWIIVLNYCLIELAKDNDFVFYGRYTTILKAIHNALPYTKEIITLDDIVKSINRMEEKDFCSIDRAENGWHLEVSFNIDKIKNLSVCEQDLKKSGIWKSLGRMERKFIKMRLFSSLVKVNEDWNNNKERIKRGFAKLNLKVKTAKEWWKAFIIRCQKNFIKVNESLKNWKLTEILPEIENYSKGRNYIDNVDPDTGEIIDIETSKIQIVQQVYARLK